MVQIKYDRQWDGFSQSLSRAKSQYKLWDNVVFFPPQGGVPNHYDELIRTSLRDGIRRRRDGSSLRALNGIIFFSAPPFQGNYPPQVEEESKKKEAEKQDFFILEPPTKPPEKKKKSSDMYFGSTALVISWGGIPSAGDVFEVVGFGFIPSAADVATLSGAGFVPFVDGDVATVTSSCGVASGDGVATVSDMAGACGGDSIGSVSDTGGVVGGGDSATLIDGGGGFGGGASAATLVDMASAGPNGGSAATLTDEAVGMPFGDSAAELVSFGCASPYGSSVGQLTDGWDIDYTFEQEVWSDSFEDGELSPWVSELERGQTTVQVAYEGQRIWIESHWETMPAPYEGTYAMFAYGRLAAVYVQIPVTAAGRYRLTFRCKNPGIYPAQVALGTGVSDRESYMAWTLLEHNSDHSWLEFQYEFTKADSLNNIFLSIRRGNIPAEQYFDSFLLERIA